MARFGLGFLSDFQTAKELYERTEAAVYTLADAAVSGAVGSPEASGATAVVEEGKKQSSDWLSGITDGMETILKVLKDGLSALHVPYAYGFAIILLTILVKAATFPLSKKQVESAMAMRSLQPQVKEIQERYAGNQEKIQLETARIYKLAGVNPLAGCLPTLATIPVWIGLYRALSNVANEGLLTEGFFWIPSLAGPTTIAAKQSGSGISWLFPFVDGHPPLGWSDTFAYLVLPVLLVVSQYISVQIMQPTQGNDPNQQNSQAFTKILPLMIGYFALSVPSGLSLYWFTNNILSTAQQIWLQKLGGANNPVKKYSERLKETENIGISSEAQANIQSLVNNASVKEKIITEQPDSGAPRPGDRFKQIKEEEARRRKERELKRLVEEAKSSVVNSSRQVQYSKTEVQLESSVQDADQGPMSSSSKSDSSNSEPTKINGSHSSQGSVEDLKSLASSNGGLSQNVDVAGKVASSAPQMIQKEESGEASASSSKQEPENDKQSTEKDG